MMTKTVIICSLIITTLKERFNASLKFLMKNRQLKEFFSILCRKFQQQITLSDFNVTQH